jgi:hypothetical protein
MSEMSEELKNKIRCERIREVVNNVIVKKSLYKEEGYYKALTIDKVKDITNDDIIELRKRDCSIYIKDLYPYIKDTDTVVEKFKEMDINEVLLITYRFSLLYQIVLHELSDKVVKQTELSLDDLEKRLVELEEKKRDESLKIVMERSKVPNKTKSWWNIF